MSSLGAGFLAVSFGRRALYKHSNGDRCGLRNSVRSQGDRSEPRPLPSRFGSPRTDGNSLGRALGI
jgi:hypothetical protein